MEHSSSGSTNSDPKNINNSAGDRDARSVDLQDLPNQRMVADRLLAALASGNLEHLAQARRAFLKQPPAGRKGDTRASASTPAAPFDEITPVAEHIPADFAGSLERRSAPRRPEHDFLPVDELRQIEDELHQAEAELQRRRVEVAAAKRKAEDEARRRVFEESRREIEAETRKRAEEEEQRLAALQSLHDQAEVATRERQHQQHELNASIQALEMAEQEARREIAEAEQRIRQSEDECRRLHVEAQQRAERVLWLNEEIEDLRKAETEQIKLSEATEARLLAQVEAKHVAAADAQRRAQKLANDERRVSEELESVRADEVKQQERLSVLTAELARLKTHLADRVKQCYLAEAESQELAEKAELVSLEHENILKNKENYARSVEEAETRLRMLAELKHGGQVSTQHRTEKELQLGSEIDAMRQAEQEQVKRIQAAEARLKEHDEARQAAKARVKELTEHEQQLLTEIEDLSRREAEQLNRLKETEARIPGYEEAVRQAEAQAQRKADEEAERLKQLELICIKVQNDATQRAAREKELQAELESLQRQEQESEPFELLDTKAIVLRHAPGVEEITPVIDSAQEPRLAIDLYQTQQSEEVERGLVPVDTAADVLGLEPVNTVDAPDHFQARAAIPNEIAQRLQSADSLQRAAALADLADACGSNTFDLITKCFDDPSIEVRNAAARALHSWQPDLAASFTRALREASPERRRKIGAAIAGSGLAANAINCLAGEGHDRYDAFSILFLMAKAGEVQPLLQAIAKHHDLEVRLIAVKLIGLSKQQHVLPGLRTMASRDSLPREVHTALMEAIYLLSNQTREIG